jgi:hypothetical protein
MAVLLWHRCTGVTWHGAVAFDGKRQNVSSGNGAVPAVRVCGFQMYINDFRKRLKMKDAPETPGDFDMILQNAEGIKKQIYFSNPEVEQNNAILEELETLQMR